MGDLEVNVREPNWREAYRFSYELSRQYGIGCVRGRDFNQARQREDFLEGVMNSLNRPSPTRIWMDHWMRPDARERGGPDARECGR